MAEQARCSAFRLRLPAPSAAVSSQCTIFAAAAATASGVAGAADVIGAPGAATPALLALRTPPHAAQRAAPPPRARTAFALASLLIFTLAPAPLTRPCVQNDVGAHARVVACNYCYTCQQFLLRAVPAPATKSPSMSLHVSVARKSEGRFRWPSWLRSLYS